MRVHVLPRPIWLLFSLLFCILAPPSAEANFWSHASCESALLSPAQVYALRQAEQGMYDVQVLTGVVDGIERTVVYLGEEHLKDLKDAQRGKEVVDRFQFIGYELAVGLQKFVFGKIMSAFVRGSYRLVERLGGMYPSTIRYALESSKQADGPMTILLEEGHEFTRREKVGLVLIAAHSTQNLALGAAVVSPLCLIPLGVMDFDYYAAVAGLAALKVAVSVSPTLNGLAKAAGRVALAPLESATGQKFTIERLYQETLCGSRNTVMVENILKAFKTNPQMRKMLVIMGMAHVPNMANDLEQSYGFKKDHLWKLPSAS